MAHLTIGWELGHGMGHILPLRMIANALIARGHKISFIVRDVALAQRTLADLPVNWLQAPQIRYQPWEMTRTNCYSQLLGNIGLRDESKLAATVQGWKNLFQAIKPDAALLEFAPSAMLACHLDGVPFALQGNGFFCPPPERVNFGVMQRKMPEAKRLTEDASLLESINNVCAQLKVDKLDHISEIYAAAKTTVLATFKELDHFAREDSSYFSGVWVPPQTAQAIWPSGTGKKIFAYLHARPGVDRLLSMLSTSGQPTLIACANLDKKFRAPFENKHCQFIDGLVDLKTLAKQADVGVFHGNHSSTAIFLLAGTPTLQVPLYMEQLLFSQRVKAIGAGEIATIDQPDKIAAALNALLVESWYRNGAEQFATRYHGFNQEEEIMRAADRLEADLL